MLMIVTTYTVAANWYYTEASQHVAINPSSVLLTGVLENEIGTVAEVLRRMGFDTITITKTQPLSFGGQGQGGQSPIRPWQDATQKDGSTSINTPPDARQCLNCKHQLRFHPPGIPGEMRSCNECSCLGFE